MTVAVSVSARLLASVLLAALLAGCGSREIRVYRVAKQNEQPKLSAQPQNLPHSAAHAHPSPIHWQLPKGWEQLPPGEMRLGDFRVHGSDGARAEVTIIPLAGRAGTDAANVNRWRGQVGLSPIAEDQLAANSESVQVGRETARLYEMAGVAGDDEKTRILAVIFRRGETSWFFKMIGNDALVETEKSTFKEFLKRILFDAVASAHAAN
jgi:hypothetical protein